MNSFTTEQPKPQQIRVRILTGASPIVRLAIRAGCASHSTHYKNRQHPNILAPVAKPWHLLQGLFHQRKTVWSKKGETCAGSANSRWRVGVGKSAVSISRPCERAVSTPRPAVSIPNVVVSNPIRFAMSGFLDILARFLLSVVSIPIEY